MGDTIDVYLEVGQKRVFACAVDWPGWTRSGRDEGSALRALLDSAPRYARVAELAGLALPAPLAEADLAVVERLQGDANTDFGAPGTIPPSDRRPVDGADLERLKRLLRASWQSFDTAAAAAAGKELQKGPRGGGRTVDGIVEHVLGGERGYLSRLGRNPKLGAAPDQAELTARVRAEVLDALDAAARGELPARGPRGGAIWPARYFVRRAAWHVLDHAWEIEDRS
jgi:DinB superfamily